MSKKNNDAEMQQNGENAAKMQQNGENAAEMQQNGENAAEMQQNGENAAQVKQEDPYQELVRFKLPIIKGEREDVMVGVNGKFWQIKRGEYVDLPRPVYEVLEHQEKMELQAQKLEKQLEQQLNSI